MYGDIPTRKPCGRVLKFVFAFPKYLHVILHRISSRSDSPPCASVCMCVLEYVFVLRIEVEI